MNPKKFPLTVAKDLQKLMSEIRLLCESTEVCEIIQKDGFMLYVKDKDEESDFYFGLQKAEQDTSKTPIFKSLIRPLNHSELTTASKTTEINQHIDLFKKWLNNLKEFNKISFRKEDKFQKQYEQQFYQYFHIVEDTQEETPLDLPSQLKVYVLLEQISRVLNDYPSDIDTEKIIEEVNTLKEEIPLLTRTNVGKRVATILSKIWKKGIELGKKILLSSAETVSKETMKKGTNYTLDHIDDIFNSLSNFFL